MLYWLTGTAGSAANIYYESMHSGRWPMKSTTPTGVAVFAEDVAIRRYAERTNTITHWSDFETGGHFAALEVPELLTEDERVFFRSLRTPADRSLDVPRYPGRSRGRRTACVIVNYSCSSSVSTKFEGVLKL